MRCCCACPNLENDPPGLWFDEAQNGLVAGQLLAPDAAHPTFIGGFTQMGGLYFYVLGLVLKLFGASIWPLRLLPALAGAAIAPLLYLLGARLYGWRVGLAAGGLVAVSAWNLTFSRFGIASLPTVALDVAVYLCAAQGLRTGRLGYFAGAGVLLGLAMQMYYAARLVPLVLAALLLHLLIRYGCAWCAWRGWAWSFSPWARAGVPAGGPVRASSSPRPSAAASIHVSVFNPQVNGGNLNRRCRHNLTKHLLMFNFRATSTGGITCPARRSWTTSRRRCSSWAWALCILRAWRWQYFFPVVWFAAALAGGVLSLPFEAPQSHRTLENSVVTALLAGIVLGEVWGALSRWAGWRRAPASPVAAARTLRPGAERRRPCLRAGRRARRRSRTGWARRRLRSRRWRRVSTLRGRGAPAPAGRERGRGAGRGRPGGEPDAAALFRDPGPGARHLGGHERAAGDGRPDAAALCRAVSISTSVPSYLDTPAQSSTWRRTPMQAWPGMQAMPFDGTDNRDVMIILRPPAGRRYWTTSRGCIRRRHSTRCARPPAPAR